MTFGVNLRKTLTGAELCIRIQQICAILPVLYLFAAASFPVVITHRNAVSVLFDLGFSCLPRLEALGISLLFRLTRSEVLVNFLLLGLALLIGLLAGALLHGKTAWAARRFLVLWIAADLLLRLLPLGLNRAFGLPAAILGFALQLGCLVLCVLDLRADRKARDKQA